MDTFRRVKILMLVILLYILNYISKTESVDLSYVVIEKEYYNESNCITEGLMINSAVGWIFPLPDTKDKLPQIKAKFIPTLESEYNCNLSKADHCSSLWKNNEWNIKRMKPENFNLLLDTRWEDLPVFLTSNKTKEFENRIEIPIKFDLGLSIRAQNDVELFLCEGWNPRTYPCYYISIGNKITLQKTKKLPAEKLKILDSAKLDYQILSEEEWRNFVVSFDETGMIRLLEVYKNKTILKYTDKKPLKSTYLFMRSNSTALWKVHQNEFLYTTVAETTKLGPILETKTSNLCIALYVSLCKNCEIKFFIKHGNDSELLNYSSWKENLPKWQFIKLIAKDVFEDQIQLYVSTIITNQSNTNNLFWAIDSVRICDRNEIRVTTLMPNYFIKSEEKLEEHISCQAIAHPKWRPQKYVHSMLNVFPAIEKYESSTSIKLFWKPYPSPVQKLLYSIEYQGYDICKTPDRNSKRIRSNGYIITEDHEVVIKDLVPYTHYNVTFSYILHENKKHILINTLPTEVPTFEELPVNLTIIPDDTTAEIKWQNPDCKNIYGQICYLIQVDNFRKEFTNFIEDTNLTIPNLEPFTNYTLNLYAARNCNDLNNGTLRTEDHFKFITKPGIPPPIENLDLYSSDFESVSLRYNLPLKVKGIPKHLQVKFCSPWLINKCESNIYNITRCKEWNYKYCVDVNNLFKMNKYTFYVSLKNMETHAFSDESRIEGYTNERVPGKPTNITYRMVNCEKELHYCHLNVSWLHPYNQNGTITSFDILLEDTTNVNATKTSIHQIYKVFNKTYMHQYSQLIKYIPYSTHFDLSLRSANYKYESNYTTPIHFKTEDIGDHIDQSPKLVGSEATTLTFEIPPLDWRLDSSLLFIIVQDYDQNVHENLSQFQLNENDFCHDFGNTWLAQVVQISHNESKKVTVGDDTSSIYMKTVIINKPLTKNTNYCITFIVRNQYKTTQHDVVYYEKDLFTRNIDHANNALVSKTHFKHLYGLLILVLFIPVGYLIYRYLYKRETKRNLYDDENIYESLPFEDCNNFVSNDTYDKLIHK